MKRPDLFLHDDGSLRPTPPEPKRRHVWTDAGKERDGTWSRCSECMVERLKTLLHTSFYSRAGRYLGSTTPACEPRQRPLAGVAK